MWSSIWLWIVQCWLIIVEIFFGLVAVVGIVVALAVVGFCSLIDALGQVWTDERGEELELTGVSSDWDC